MAFDQINPAIPALTKTRDEKARSNFLRSFRRYIFEDLARVMREDYATQVASRSHAQGAPDAEEIHRLMRQRSSFQFYSALRVASQDLLYQVVRPPIERMYRVSASTAKSTRSAKGRARHGRTARLHLEPGLPVPRSVSAVDIHLMPGSYTAAYADDDMAMGAVYDARLRISTFGVFGPDLDDIGQSVAQHLRALKPSFQPRRILDLGCTVGHNTLPWQQAFPRAELHGIDVAAPCLRYAYQRANTLRMPVNFWQMNAKHLQFPDHHFDVVFSSMFLHEVPKRDIPVVLREAYRVLRPGGVMLHMELPPASAIHPYDSFYLDWDGRYNNEPYYRSFRAMNPRAAVGAAGFKPHDFFEWVVPSQHAARFIDPLVEESPPESTDDRLGRLAQGVKWYVFGARK
ncbi:MAG: class I SAM-dependent methyltransferase [Steroidobacteraceae bacterium]